MEERSKKNQDDGIDRRSFGKDSYHFFGRCFTLYFFFQGFIDGDIQEMIDALQLAENAERLKEGNEVYK